MTIRTCLLQLAALSDPFLQVVLGLALAGTIMLAVLFMVLNDRRKAARKIDLLLLDQMTVSLADLRTLLRKPRLDTGALRGIIGLCNDAILGFTGTTVVSAPLLRERLRRLIHDDSIVRTAQEADMWSLSDATVANLIEAIAKSEGIDIIRTRTGDYVVVSYLKSRFHDDLQFQGRIDIKNEAQRLGAEQSDLIEMVYSWGWDIIEVSDDVLASTDWVRVLLERMVLSEGRLNPEEAATAIGVSIDDLFRLLKRLDWKTITATDGGLIPLHTVEEYLSDRIERNGIVDLNEASEHFGLSHDSLLKILRNIDRQIIETTSGEAVTLDYIRRQVDASIRMSGWAHPEDIADLLGIDPRLVVQVLRSEEEYRRVADGRYISLRFFRDWLLDLINDQGIIPLDLIEKEWGLSRVDVRVLIKRFGIKTTTTTSGDLLSLQWARDRINAKIESGESVSPEYVAREFNVEIGVAVALIANVESSAYQTHDGRLVPERILREDLRKRFIAKGVIDPEKEAHRLGLDVSVVERLVDSLAVDAVETNHGARVSIAGILKYIRKRLDDNGVADLAKVAESSGIDYKTLVSLLERRLLDTETLVDAAQCVVRTDWVKKVIEPLASTGQIPVTEFAKKYNIRRRAALHLLRVFLKGAYIKSRDLFIAVPSA
ncbi:MAG: hypothetical protein K9W43_06005 [Candidatus Thorarchaeota archaeon]|nr:hypothetical protein [Candidatus Thorarchaeota archaeon]